MRISALLLTAALSLVILPSIALAGGSLDGTWTGSWGGNSPYSKSATVKIVGGKVVEYDYAGASVPVGNSKVTTQTATFGAGYSVRMTLAPDGNHATASYSGHGGNASAYLSR